MTAASEKIAQAAWHIVPAPLERKLRTEAGMRFLRFALVAAIAVITSQVALALLTGPINASAGLSGVVASMIAAAVSYVLSRWAWERKGKPDLLRETLPFWVVSFGVWIVLGLTSHYASVWAHSMGYTHLHKHLVVQGAYLIMNCVTFVARFLIFHFLLFANRDRQPAGAVDSGLVPAEAAAGGSDTGPMAVVPGGSVPDRGQGRYVAQHGQRPHGDRERSQRPLQHR
jgi:putative flippase GtrA